MPVGELWQQALLEWSQLSSDADAVFDKTVAINCHDLEPKVTRESVRIKQVPSPTCPFPEQETNPLKRPALEKALHYMGLTAGMLLKDIRISHAFIGSCTNGRIEDLRAVAKVLEGRKIASHVRGSLCPAQQW